VFDAGLPVRALFTERVGGASSAPYHSLNLATHVGDDPAAVALNRAIVADALSAPVVYMAQQHGVRVAEVTAAGVEPVADVLITRTPGLAVAVLVADCVPVLLHDEATGAVAAIHAGRVGLYRGVIDAAVAALVDVRGGWGVPGRMSAAIGPAICGRCYEVPPAMRTLVATRHPSAFGTTSWGTASLDLPRAVETRLGELGFAEVVRHRLCTLEDEQYFSHRRAAPTGRFAGVVVCEGK